MKNISTPDSAGMLSIKKTARTQQPGPRKSTIMLIRQFARAYSYTAPLPVALGGFNAN